MSRWVLPEDVRVWISEATEAQVAQLIQLAEGQALAVAPTLAIQSLSEDQRDAVKGVLLAAIRRWWDAGSGAYQSRTEGPFSATLSSAAVVGQFYPSEVKALGRIAGSNRVFSINVTPEISQGYPSWVVNRPESEGSDAFSL